MEIQEILDELRYNTGVFPRDALQAAVEKQTEITAELLRILEYADNNIEEIAGDSHYFAHIFAMYLLAQFREKRAYPLIVEFISRPFDILDRALGGVITEDLGRILASVSCGDTSLIRELIENRQLNEYVRSAALRALPVLITSGDMSRDEVVQYFHALFHDRLEKEPSLVWDSLVVCCCDIYPEDLYEEIKAAYDEGLVDPWFIAMDDVESVLQKSRDVVLSHFMEDNSQQLITDVIGELEWWACFNAAPQHSRQGKKRRKRKKKSISQLLKKKPVKAIQPQIRHSKKIGRNDPCPCGSGKKYKKCCGA